jgi:hypothetical protein
VERQGEQVTPLARPTIAGNTRTTSTMRHIFFVRHFSDGRPRPDVHNTNLAVAASSSGVTFKSSRISRKSVFKS